MRNFDRDDIQVSTKHVKLRIVLFVLALLVAIGAITYGVSELGKKAPGYYRIEATADEELLLLDGRVNFQYVFKGSKSEINAEMRQLQALYCASLRSNSRLLDAENTYTGVINLAEINANPGREMMVSGELFEVLVDALALTREEQGYSLFAGPLRAEWNSLLILADPEPFDPAADPDEAERLARLSALVSDLSNFSFEIVDPQKHTVRFDFSDRLRECMRELELDCPVLDLNLLHDAYLLRLIARDLEAQGYTNGCLTAASGVTLSLSGHNGGDLEYSVIGFDGEYCESAATLPMEAGSAYSLLRAFALDGEAYGYYTAETDGGTVYRHPNVPVSGECPAVLFSVGVRSTGMDPVRAVYEGLRLFACADREAVAACAGTFSDAAVWTLQGEGQRVFSNAAAAPLLRKGDYGWTLETIS